MAPINFGILMVPFQALDAVGPTDILSSSCKKYFAPAIDAGFYKESFPDEASWKSLADRAIDIIFHHIGETMEPVSLTSGFRVLPNTTCKGCPELDYLLVGGPDPLTFKLGEEFSQFIKDHVAKGKVIFTTCTVAFIIAPTGVLNGKRATTNHAALDYCEVEFPGCGLGKGEVGCLWAVLDSWWFVCGDGYVRILG